MENQNTVKKINIIVIGAGPAGVACAVTLARAGKQVLLVERGSFAGAKNMFGGAVYTKPVMEIFPDFIEKNAPIERFITQHKYLLLDDTNSTTISHEIAKKENVCEYESFSTFRAKWDKWCATQAQNEGVIIAENTTVRKLLTENKKVVGIRTDYEEYYCDLVVLADGVNSLLAQQIGLRKELAPDKVALGIKEVIKLPPEIINERFGLADDTGCVVEFAGGAMKGVVGLGYIYTNKNSIAIGIGVGVDELKRLKTKPYQLLEQIKQHPSIAPLIKDGELLEYNAHLIPEGGYKAVGKLFANGVLVTGDAAGLVNNVHWEGTNLAMLSGKMAAEVAIEASDKNDYSEKTLSKYQKKLEKSFIFKDLKSYADIMEIIHHRKESYLGFWIKKVGEFFDVFTSVDCIPKKKKFFDYGFGIIRQRKLIELFKDLFNFVRIVIRIFR